MCDLAHQPISYHIDRLKRGWRFCTACGLPKVHPSEYSGTIYCDECLKTPNKRAERYCISCGDKIPLSRMEFYKSKNHPPCRQCMYCHRGQTMPHIVFGVKCPRNWRDTSKPADQKIDGPLSDLVCSDCKGRISSLYVNDREKKGYTTERCDMCDYYRQTGLPNPKLVPSAN